MAGLLERRPSQISDTSIHRRRLRVGALPLELHPEESKGLYLVPFCQGVASRLVTPGRKTPKKISGRVGAPLLGRAERFSHLFVEPYVIQVVAFTSHHTRPSWAKH
jgi:hypothetical protein